MFDLEMTMQPKQCWALMLFVALTFWIDSAPITAADRELQEDALQAMKRAASYYRTKVASHGGYVYYYSTDLQQRWGEGKAATDTIFVQPPGTPTVGMAYLDAFAATDDPFYLDAAREAAEALVDGQLASGGWTQVIHFAKPKQGRLGKYRKGHGGNWNVSSLDDGQTQAALQFLIRVDEALDFKHEEIHEATLFGLDSLLKAQFENGGFPQGWQAPVARQPVLKAKYPEYDWKSEGKVKNYWDYYTLNDNLAGTVADTLLKAHRVYGDDKYKAALQKLGDFLLLAQLQEPQPAWCQQYSYDMVPIWARKFEPPAIASSESQDVMNTLIKIAEYTGQKRFLEPIPSAVAYFKKSLLSDGRVARFYELRTNKPLYMDGKYQLTYDDADAPAHYGWKKSAHFDRIERDYRAAKNGERLPHAKVATLTETEAKRIITDADDQGRWVSTYAGESLVGQPNFAKSFRYISSAVFSRNLSALSAYVAALPNE